VLGAALPMVLMFCMERRSRLLFLGLAAGRTAPSRA